VLDLGLLVKFVLVAACGGASQVGADQDDTCHGSLQVSASHCVQIKMILVMIVLMLVLLIVCRSR
jgi:hypothetical protein